jgi:aspartyl-tRNA synthetase
MAEALRTHRVGDLTASSRNVRLAGWVDSRRDHGGVIFFDLRDSTGIVQVVVDPEAHPELGELCHGIRLEYCIAVSGDVRSRPAGTENLSMATGSLEVAVAGLTVLSAADALPFQIDDRVDVEEVKRLEYRYLDLRRPQMAANLRARSAAVSAIRRQMDDLGFMEVETPTLIRSTPEGARDLLVPSRLRHGYFYALPQSPQLFKQLLMISGVDRYYQIARCYRDEDTRADRQIEFTQLDIEGAFWGRDDVLATIEQAVAAATAAVRGERPSTPFPRMTWQEAMDRFGTDKPDTRFGMELIDLSEAFAGSGFKAFSAAIDGGGVVRGINVGPQELARSGLDALVELAQGKGARGLVWMFVETDGTLRSPVAKFISDAEVAAVTSALDAAAGDLLLAVADSAPVAGAVLGELRLRFGKPEVHDELQYLWVVDFPVFERGSEGQLVPAHHPFTAPVDVEEMASDPEHALSKAYDLVVNGVELGSGSVRIHDPETQRRVFEVLGITDEAAEAKFGWFMRALRYGTPPHAGFAVGIDRLVSILRKEENIRQVMPFPKTQSGMDPLTGSPTPVEALQLAELGIEVVAEE